MKMEYFKFLELMKLINELNEMLPDSEKEWFDVSGHVTIQELVYDIHSTLDAGVMDHRHTETGNTMDYMYDLTTEMLETLPPATLAKLAHEAEERRTRLQKQADKGKVLMFPQDRKLI